MLDRLRVALFVLIAFGLCACATSDEPGPGGATAEQPTAGRVDVGGYELAWMCRGSNSPTIIAELPASVPGHLRGLVTTLSSVLLEALVEHPSERVVLAGSANLTEHVLDFPAIRPVLEALEEQVVLLRLLDQQTTTAGKILVRIGNENPHEGLQTASVVSAGYGTAGIALGGLGVLGPRRMDYAHTMARVAAVASYMGELLAEN